MKRPSFTEKENYLISYILTRKRNIVSELLLDLPWVVIPGVLFFYGFFAGEQALVMAGFLLIFFISLRYISHQANGENELKTILQKYENSLKNQEKQFDANSKTFTENE